MKKFSTIDEIRVNQFPQEESDQFLKLFQYKIKEDLFEKQKLSEIGLIMIHS